MQKSKVEATVFTDFKNLVEESIKELTRNYQV